MIIRDEDLVKFKYETTYGAVEYFYINKINRKIYDFNTHHHIESKVFDNFEQKKFIINMMDLLLRLKNFEKIDTKRYYYLMYIQKIGDLK